MGGTTPSATASTNRANTSVQIIGARDPAGLDKKPANATRRMSAHAHWSKSSSIFMISSTVWLPTATCCGCSADSSRLVKQSYLEFDLDRIFTDGLFADFAVLYRLLHATRLPLTNDTAAESLIERYHQDSLDSGARIREGLSKAVEQAILDFGSGFLLHILITTTLRADASDVRYLYRPRDYYQHLLRLIYRLLFLMVIEERDLVFPADAPRSQRDIHHTSSTASPACAVSRRNATSPTHAATISGLHCKPASASSRQTVRATKLGIAPLAGDLFSAEAMGSLASCTLGNDVFLGCLRSLSLYQTSQQRPAHPRQLRSPQCRGVRLGLRGLCSNTSRNSLARDAKLRFGFRRGDQRAATGSHYTPDDLVQPLIRHSLDHLIAERLDDDDPEAALLDLRVADIACGSGHILLAAARRIATEAGRGAHRRRTALTAEPTVPPLRDVIRTLHLRRRLESALAVESVQGGPVA